MTSATKPGKKNGPWAAVTWTWDWDALGRLVDYNNEVSYTYDAHDRIATRGTDAFTYDGFGLDPTTTGTETYSRTPGGRLVGITDTSTASLVGLDRHGDLTHLFDPAGQVSDTVSFDPFGDPRSATGTFMAQVGFQGDYTDPTSGRVWMGARWYDAGWASFLTRDTRFGELHTPISLNRYTYARANPLAYWDPDGQQFTCLAIDGIVCATASQEVKQETLTHTSTVREYIGSQTTYTQDTPQTADQGADQTVTQTGNDAVVSGATPGGWAPSDGDANIVWCAYATYSCPGGGTAPVRVVLDGFTRFSAQATDAIANNVVGIANFAVDIIPGVGDLKAFGEAVAGTDVLGRRLTPGQRWLIAGTAIFFFGNEAKAAIRHADELLDATNAAGQRLYRAVEPDELADIVGMGAYRTVPGFEGKLIFPTQAQADDFAALMTKADIGGPYCTTSGCIPSNVLSQIEAIPIAGEGPAYFIPEEFLSLIDDIVIHGG